MTPNNNVQQPKITIMAQTEKDANRSTGNQPRTNKTGAQQQPKDRQQNTGQQQNTSGSQGKTGKPGSQNKRSSSDERSGIL
jgi:hypothetical protein